MQDSLVKIIGVSAGVCLVCSVLVSAAAVVLKPYQEQNALLYKQQNILSAAGLLEPGKKPTAAEAQKFFDEKRIEALVVDLESGDVVEGVDPNSIDPAKEAKDASQSTDLGADNIAKIGRRPNRAVVYVTKKNDKADKYVFPIYGKGLWSTMYGFIALNAGDLSVAAINFYAHGETPGLGGEIENPAWQKHWVGKKVYDKLGDGPKIEVVKGAVAPEDVYKVDGIAGSTLTGNGVSNTVRFWLGQHGFEPFLQRLTAGPGPATQP